MSNRWLTTTGLVLAVVLLFAVNVLGARFFGGSRVDLTENKLYTLSDGTKRILEQLPEQVRVNIPSEDHKSGRLSVGYKVVR